MFGDARMGGSGCCTENKVKPRTATLRRSDVAMRLAAPYGLLARKPAVGLGAQSPGPGWSVQVCGVFSPFVRFEEWKGQALLPGRTGSRLTAVPLVGGYLLVCVGYLRQEIGSPSSRDSTTAGRSEE